MKITTATIVLLVTVASGCSSTSQNSNAGRFQGNDISLSRAAIIHSGDSQSDIRAKLRSLR